MLVLAVKVMHRIECCLDVIAYIAWFLVTEIALAREKTGFSKMWKSFRETFRGAGLM